MEKTSEQYEKDIAELKAFYDFLAEDLKRELAEMADKKSMQAAFHNKYRKESEYLQAKVIELEQIIVSQKESESKKGGK